MPWAKIDDRLFLNPKWLATPPAARGLWVTALSYCSLQMTGGFVLAAILPMLGGTTADADALVSSGLWERDGDNYLIHDYHEWNPTKEEVEAKRSAISEVRAKAGQASGEARRNKAQSNCNHSRTNREQNLNKIEQTVNPEPEPEPEPVSQVVVPTTAPKPPTAADGGGSPNLDFQPEGMKPDALLKAYRQRYPEREQELQRAIASASGRVLSQAAYLKPYILRRLSGEEPDPIPVPTESPPRRLTAAEQRDLDGKRKTAEYMTRYAAKLGATQQPATLSLPDPNVLDAEFREVKH